MYFNLNLKGQAQQFTFVSESSLLKGRDENVKGVEVCEWLAGQCHSPNTNF